MRHGWWIVPGCLLLAQPALAWSCRNEQLEIRCTAESCEKSESFTPMSVSVTERGKVSVCAYSGCWEGRAQAMQRAGGFLYVSGNFRFSSPPRDKTELAVMIDRKARVATLIGAGFAHPMTCKP